MPTRFGFALGALVFWLACGAIAHAGEEPVMSAPGDPLAAGRALYLEGRRADGQPMVAGRAGGLGIAGAEAACVNCHRRSGLGGSEGRSYIPPITGASLSTAMPVGKGASARGDGRPAYTESTLARALRAGVDPTGRPLDFLMPRYQLRDDEVKALLAYLRQLPRDEAPAAATAALDFATVLAPGIAPEQGRAMVEVLQACFDEHNAGPGPERGRKRLGPGMSQRGARPWQLHVWPLTGEPQTWAGQLESHARAQPVFAVVGGVGAGQWAPVHGFCEKAGVPCLFPHVEAPVADAGAFYPVYLGQGVLLEAGLVARRIAEAGGGRVVQVLRDDDASAQAGADALERALTQQRVRAPQVRIGVRGPVDARVFADLGAADILVLWLRPQDLRALEGIAPIAETVFVSATLAAQDAVPLPAAWRDRTLIAYPYELPRERAARDGKMQKWLQAHGVRAGDERVQSDAYVACTALRSGMQEIEDHPGRDYLVERLEANLERGTATGLYPRLALGIGQRFASKAGYLVRLDPAGSGQLLPEGERFAP